MKAIAAPTLVADRNFDFKEITSKRSFSGLYVPKAAMSNQR